MSYRARSYGSVILCLSLVLVGLLIPRYMLSDIENRQYYSYIVVDKEEVSYSVVTPSNGYVTRVKYNVYVRNKEDGEDTNVHCISLSETEYSNTDIGDTLRLEEF